MNEVFERFVSSIVSQTDCSYEERIDLSEELLSHLECSYEDFQDQGFSKEEAMEMAMMNFGDEKKVGKQLQQAMYPYRREMMLILASASLVMVYSVYFLQLFTRGDAHIIWLVLASFTGASILTVTLHPVRSLNRRLWMNVLLISHILIFAYGALLASDLELLYSDVLSFFSYAIVLLSIILIYRTTIFDFPSNKQPLQKVVKWIHFINITIGIVFIWITLFLLSVFLLIAEEFHALLLLGFVPIMLWIISYAVQMRLLANSRKVLTYIIALLQILVIVAALTIWIFWM